ncbi:MAG: hypothetical protein WCQ90_15000 [Deltaproteobacteria bacterium]
MSFPQAIPYFPEEIAQEELAFIGSEYGVAALVCQENIATKCSA